MPTALRERRALDLAAEKFGWGKPLPEGHAAGIAVHASFGSYVAQVSEVSLEGGMPRVHRVVCAIDCGPVVNPLAVEAQMQSGIVYGLSAARTARSRSRLAASSSRTSTTTRRCA